MTTLSALVTVYHRIPPAQLQQALDSLAAQTRPAEEIVLVVDGPIGDELNSVITAFGQDHPELKVIRLEQNQGLAAASQAGLEAIQGEWLARLDADDVAYPERFERQLEAVDKHPEVDVIGTAVSEFSVSPSEPNQHIRRLPAATHAEISRYARTQTPLNNPSAMLRVAAIHSAGGFKHVQYMEDYDLYARMLADGAQFLNLPEVLTYFRVDDAQLARRTTNMAGPEWQMQRNLVSYGLISWPRAVLNFALRMGYRMLPTALIKRAYAVLFHRK